MTLRSVAVLFFIAVGLTTYALIYETGAAPWDGAGKVFRDLQPSDVVWIEISREVPSDERAAGVDDRPIELERRGEYEWYISKPIEFRAFLPRVQGVLWEIVDMVQVSEISPSAPDHASWAGENGARPVVTVRFRTSSGQEHRIEIGRPHPIIEKDIFARIDGESGRVIVTRAEARTAFTASLDELRSRALIPIPPADCVHLAVTDPKSRASKAMSRVGETREWRFDDGSRHARHAVDRRFLNEFLTDLNAWAVHRFVNASAVKELAEKGLKPPVLELLARSARGVTVHFEIGSTFEEAGETFVWLRRPTDGEIFVAKNKPLEPARREAEHFRTRFVFDFEGDEIEKVECRTPDKHFVVHKEKVERSARPGSKGDSTAGSSSEAVERWMVEDYARKERFLADDILLGEAFGELHQVLIEKFLPGEDEGASAFDPKDSIGSIRVTLRDGGAHTLRFHALPEDQRDVDLGAVVSSRSGDPSRFLVVSRWPVRLHVGSYVFRDRMISQLDPSRVVELEVAAGDTTWTLAQLNNEWSFSVGRRLIDGRELDTSLLNDVVQALHADRFRVHAFTPEVASDLFAGYGIGDSDFHLRIKIPTVLGARYSGFRTLTIGTRQKIDESTELHFARCDTISIPFTLPRDLPRRLEKLVAHLRQVTGES